MEPYWRAILLVAIATVLLNMPTVLADHRHQNTNRNRSAREVITRPLTSEAARRLVTSPRNLVRKAIQLVRRRRSMRSRNFGPVHRPIAQRRVQRSLHPDDEHVIDKRQIVDFPQEIVLTSSRRPISALRRRKKDIHVNDELKIIQGSRSRHKVNLSTLEEVINKIVPLLKGRRGRDGRDGRNGRDGVKGDVGPPGQPGPQGAPAPERLKPSGHITTKLGKIYFADGQEFQNWTLSAPTSHIVDGMQGNKADLIVPRRGRYFIYCQLYFLEIHTQPAGFEIMVDGIKVATKISQAGQSAYLGAVFYLKDTAVISVVTRGSGIIVGDPTLSFFGASAL